MEKFNSSLGEVKIKIGTIDGISKKMPEFDDCLKLAKKHKIPVWKVYNKIIGEI